jgi:periplasmic divalent cation tolerance protein
VHQPGGEFVVVLCTAPNDQTAREIARDLVERRLAACVNVAGGLLSVYRWQGAVHEESEVLLLIKTRAILFEALAAAIAARHPYSTPEIIALPIVAGAAPYLSWLAAETAPDSRR